MEGDGRIMTRGTSSCVDKSLVHPQVLESRTGPLAECSLMQKVDEVRFNLYVVLELQFFLTSYSFFYAISIVYR